MLTWLAFVGLALVWGSSFLMMKVAYDQLDASTITLFRLGLAAIVFAGFLRLTNRRWPTDPATRRNLVLVGILNTAVPFTVLTWGTGQIDSGLATILTATTPLFALTLGHFLLADERLTAQKITGLLIGFGGVVVLGLKDIGTDRNPLIGQLAIMCGTFCYAICLIIIRRKLRKVEPIVIAGTSVIAGTGAQLLIWLPIFLAGGLRPLPDLATLKPEVAGAALTLALVQTVVAYFLFYHLVGAWGPRASLVTYAMPPIGVVLGVLVLGEPLGWRLIVGGLMILCGIVLTQRRRRPRAVPGALANPVIATAAETR